MNPRKEALLALTDIVEEGAYSNIRLGGIHASEEETAFICALVYTSLEHLFRTDHILSFYCKRQKKTVRNILRLAVTELLYMDTPDYAAVNEAVSLCRQMGKSASAGLVNAVLHRVIKDKDHLPPLPEKLSERISIEYTVPEEFAAEWLDKFGEETLMRMLRRSSPVTEIRAQWPYTREKLLERFPEAKSGTVEKDCCLLPAGSVLPGDPLIKEGKAVFQSEGAMAICRFAGIVPGEKVLDACAAPGGKSAYLYSLAQGDIDLTCWEIHEHRVVLMQNMFRLLGVNAAIECKDASVREEKYTGRFDTVLLDVPCSGLGLIGTKPDVGINKNARDLSELIKTQEAILETCSQYVRPGGKIIYATCTVSKRENEDRVTAFIKDHPGFTLEEQIQLLPNIHTSGGFYMARMRACT